MPVTLDTQDIRERSAFALASDLECGSPDASVRDATLVAVASALADGGEPDDVKEDAAHEISDDAPDTYTHAMWLQFIDLAAYQEQWQELNQETPGNKDMSAQATTALYEIANALVFSIVQELQEQFDALNTVDEDDE